MSCGTAAPLTIGIAYLKAAKALNKKFTDLSFFTTRMYNRLFKIHTPVNRDEPDWQNLLNQLLNRLNVIVSHQPKIQAADEISHASETSLESLETTQGILDKFLKYKIAAAEGIEKGKVYDWYRYVWNNPMWSNQINWSLQQAAQAAKTGVESQYTIQTHADVWLEEFLKKIHWDVLGRILPFISLAPAAYKTYMVGNAGFNSYKALSTYESTQSEDQLQQKVLQLNSEPELNDAFLQSIHDARIIFKTFFSEVGDYNPVRNTQLFINSIKSHFPWSKKHD